jgi:hypothetical protein
MFDFTVTLQDHASGRSSRIHNGLRTLAAASQYTRVRSAMAYARLNGCEQLVGALKASMPNWTTTTKEWLVGIDFGLTDPEALERLAFLPKSKVHVPNAQRLLATKLSPDQCFHPKTFIFDVQQPTIDTPVGIFTGSANLTLSGLNAGSEHGVALLWRSPLSKKDRESLNRVKSELSWWDFAWSGAEPLNGSFLASYRKLHQG